MANINSITFDEAAYAVGATITATVNFTPDTHATPPGTAPQTFTLSAVLKDTAGNQLTSSEAPFVVDVPTAGSPGDAVSVSDSGGRTWTEGAPGAPDGSGAVSVAFAAVA